MPGVVKFTYDFSKEKVEFLDLEIKIEDGKLETNLYIKPANLQLYLDYFSNHPEHCKVGLVYSQALRIVERCSKEDDKISHLANLKQKLKDRNYPEDLIDKKFEKASKFDRKDLIFKKKKTPPKDEKVRLIFTHTAANPPIHQWLREGKKHLAKNGRTKAIGQNIQIASKQPKNLQRIVSSSNFREGGQAPPQNPGCFKCRKCHACPIVKEGCNFLSTNTKKKYKVKQNLTCNSSYIVYLATCLKCDGQYVGKSSQLFKRRHSGHKQEVKNCYGGLGQHYGGPHGCGYDNFSVQIIDQVEHGNEEALSECELYWAHQLRAYVENGGQAHSIKKEFG